MDFTNAHIRKVSTKPTATAEVRAFLISQPELIRLPPIGLQEAVCNGTHSIRMQPREHL